MYFNRKLYLEKLISADGNGMIKIVTGIRRCGKSFLLFNIFKHYLVVNGVSDSHIITLAMDDRRNRDLTDPDKLLAYIDSLVIPDGRKYYVIIDEVQMVNEFVSVLLSLMQISDVEIYVSGSNSKFLSSDITTEFRGRGWEIKVHPLSFSEYYEVAGGDVSSALETYYLYGGLPGVMQISSVSEKQTYLKEIFETVYLRDIIERNGLKNADGFKELTRVLASSMGSSLNPTRIANTFKTKCGMVISSGTILKYLDFLKDAFIINESLRYDVKGRKYIGTETKYYFEDVGIRNAIIDFRQIEYNHTMENVIYNELCKDGFTVDVGMVETYRQGPCGKTERNKLEIDFVVNKHDQRLYIQSAFTLSDDAKMQQEQSSLLNVNDGFKKMIIVGNQHLSHFNENGIFIMSIFDFLSKWSEEKGTL